MHTENTHEKKITDKIKYPREKVLDKAPAEQWHETHETHDCTRPTKFSTLQEKQLPQVALPQDF